MLGIVLFLARYLIAFNLYRNGPLEKCFLLLHVVTSRWAGTGGSEVKGALKYLKVTVGAGV